jgi:hypothetical protein
MFELAFVKAITGFFAKIGIKGVLIILAVAAAGYGEYRLYDYGKTTQLAVDAPKIKLAQDQLAAYKASYAKWITDSNTATAALKATQKATLDDLHAQLATANAKAQQKQIIYKQVTHYVTTADDALCTLNSGFVQLYNGAFEDPNTSQSPALSSSAGGYLETRSNIRLSQFAGVAFNNDLKAVQLRTEVLLWREWYAKMSASFNLEQQKADASAPVMLPNK